MPANIDLERGESIVLVCCVDWEEPVVWPDRPAVVRGERDCLCSLARWMV